MSIDKFKALMTEDQQRGSQAAYDLIPAWALPFIPPLYATEQQENPIVWIKLFLPDTNWTWLITEYSPDQDLAFGLVQGLDTELGYIHLGEIRAVRSPSLKLPVEREIFTAPKPITEWDEYLEIFGKHGGPYKPKPELAATAQTSQEKEPVPISPEDIKHVRNDGWTAADFTYLLEKLAETPILAADTRLGIPTIHQNFGIEVKHCGYGVFKVEKPGEDGFELSFCGGGALDRTPSEQGWTSLRIHKGSYPYPTEEVHERLKAWLAIFEEGQPASLPAEEPVESPAEAPDSPADSQHPMEITLTYGDNGSQVFFEGSRYILLNPYFDNKDGQRCGGGWVLHQKVKDGFAPVSDPSGGEHTQVGSYSLSEVVSQAAEVLGTNIELLGRPDDLPDSFPVPALLSMLDIQDEGAPETTEEIQEEVLIDPVDCETVPSEEADSPKVSIPEMLQAITPEEDRAPDTGESTPAEAESDDRSMFEAFELELTTGNPARSSSAFHRALKAIDRPGALRLALNQLNSDRGRQSAIEKRLKALEVERRIPQ